MNRMPLAARPRSITVLLLGLLASCGYVAAADSAASADKVEQGPRGSAARNIQQFAAV